MRPNTLGIIGLGAIGGSLAWRARAAEVPCVLGWSPEPAERVRACELGALDDAPLRVEDVARRADLLVLAAPPRASQTLLEALARSSLPTAFLTDVGAVKTGIVADAARLGLGSRFAGSHPFVAVRGQGFEAATRELLRGALVYVCPAGDDETAAREVSHFWETVCEAETVVVDAERHDRQVASTSHLPRAVASALARALARQVPAGIGVAADALETTRGATANPALWSEVLCENAGPVLDTLRALDQSLAELRELLERRASGGLRGWLEQAAAWRGSRDR